MIISDNKLFSYLLHSRFQFFVVVIIMLIAIAGCSKKTTETKVEKTFHQSATLTTITPEQGYVITRSYLGQIKAKQHTSLSFEYAGKIKELRVDDGDIVLKDQVLAIQDTQLLTYKTSELQASIRQLTAQIKLNQANLTRIETLISDGYSSRQRLDELNAENQVLSAQIDGINAQINTLDYQKAKARLIAPFDGVITKRLTSTGAVISPDMPIFRLIEQGNNEISVGVPAKLASTLQREQLLTITLTNQEKTKQKARLIAIGQQINTINRTVQLRLKLTTDLNNNEHFNGQLVRVAIEDKIQKTGFWLPLAAITDGIRGQWQVFIASPVSQKNHTFTLQTAIVNIVHADEYSVYVTGLPIETHNIVSQGVHRYVGGQVIKSAVQNTQLIPVNTEQLTVNAGAQ